MLHVRDAKCETVRPDGAIEYAFGNGIKYILYPSGASKAVVRGWEGGRGSAPVHRTFSSRHYDDPLFAAAEFKLLLERAKRQGGSVAGLARDPGVSLLEFCDTKFWPFVESELAPNTQLSYACMLDKYVVPRWGETPIDEIGRKEVDAWRRDLLAKGIGSSSVQSAFVVLRSILRRALDEELITHDPLMKMKSVYTGRSHNRDARSPITLERIRAAVSDDPTASALEISERQAYLSLLEEGVRPGEGAAVKWSDFITRDGAVKGSVLIERATSGRADEPGESPGTRSTKPTKNHQYREVLLWEFAGIELHDLWVMRGRPDLDEFVFTDEGRVWFKPQAYYYEWWCNAVAVAGVPRLHIYNLRHTAASYGKLKADPAFVARQLGHSIAEFHRTYSHALSPAEVRRWAHCDDYGQIVAEARRIVAEERVGDEFRRAA